MMPVIARDKLGLGAGGLRRAARLRRRRRTHRRARHSPRSATGSGGHACCRSHRSRTPALLVVVFARAQRAARLPDAVLPRVRDDRRRTPSANATIQHLVPNELRGRMMAAYSFINVGLSQVFGSVFAGTVAHVIGVSWAVGGGGAILLGFCVLGLSKAAGTASRSEASCTRRASSATPTSAPTSRSSTFRSAGAWRSTRRAGGCGSSAVNASDGTSRRSRSGGRRSRSVSGSSARRARACRPTTSASRACTTASSSCVSARRMRPEMAAWRYGDQFGRRRRSI